MDIKIKDPLFRGRLGLFVRVLAILTCLILTVYCLIPIAANNFHIGVWFPVAVLLLVILRIAFHGAIKRSGKVIRVLVHVAEGIFVLGVAAAVVTSGFMAAAVNKKSDKSDTTLVVLGCQVRGDTVSPMLRDRLVAAAGYLEEHPDAPVIVSGGQGEGENVTEAEAMCRWLVDYGIDPDRIYIEDGSTNTSENLVNSMEIIRENGLSRNIVIATNDFHQLRAQMIAKRAGYTSVGSAPCSTVWYLRISSWVREWFGIARVILLGY